GAGLADQAIIGIVARQGDATRTAAREGSLARRGRYELVVERGHLDHVSNRVVLVSREKAFGTQARNSAIQRIVGMKRDLLQARIGEAELLAGFQCVADS